MEDSMEIDEEEQHVKKNKTKKRKQSKIEDGVVWKKRNIKGILLSVTKPSYTLKRGIGRDLRSLRCEHRNRLRYLLRQLVRRQNWDEACGVLSLLLKGTHKESGLLLTNRFKYWSTLELLEHMEAATLKTKTVQKVYDIWSKKDFAFTKSKRSLKNSEETKSKRSLKESEETKNKRSLKKSEETKNKRSSKESEEETKNKQSLKDSEDTKNKRSLKESEDTKNKRSLKNSEETKNKRSSYLGRWDVRLEFLLLCLSRGDTERAKQNVISIQQEKGFEDNAIANLVAGLTFSYLWYNAIPKEVWLHDSLESSSPIQSVMSGPHEIMLTDHLNGQSAVEVQDSDFIFQPDSNTSIRIGKGVDHDRKVPTGNHEVKKETDNEDPNNSNESDQNGNFSRFPHTGNKTFGSIVDAHDLDHLLMPLTSLRTKKIEDIQPDHYKAAVKHLQNALRSTSPAFEALLPLIQMLLIGDQVKEAIEVVESVVQNANAALPFRLKASLMEHFSKEDANILSICFEDTLRKDPTCSHSLAKLISLRHVVLQTGGQEYLERLVEMIALHLDATYADKDIWKEFASCFIELSQCDEEDRMSSCANSYGYSYTKFSKNIPDMFQNDKSRKNWKLRCRWWQTRHFTQTILASEVNSGNMEIVAYKAASACHLYGPEFAYVVTARRYLLKMEKYEEIDILKEHMENAIGFTKHNTRSWTNSNM